MEALKVLNDIPKVSIVGRPNVGKSTFFNCLVGRRKAIVQEESGTTRDRIYAPIRWGEKLFTLIDTGGMRLEKKDFLGDLVDREVEKAIKEAQCIIFMVDGRSGLTPLDEELADKLRRLKKPVILAVNKMDAEWTPSESGIFYKLGFKEVFSISAAEEIGIGDMMECVITKIPRVADTPQTPHFSLGIVGEPNVGKSTLLNSFLNEERAIVSEVAGTTRDSLEETIGYHKHFIRLIDTAGIRHKRKIAQASDLFSLSRAKNSIQESDVTFLLFDASLGVRRDTKVIAGYLEESRRPALLVANKWDLVKKVEQFNYEKELKTALGFLRYAPLVFISAKNHRNLSYLLEKGIDLWERSCKHISTKELIQFLERMRNRRLPSPAIRLKFLTQTSATPQEFVCFAKNVSFITKNFRLYFENELIKHFGLEGIPLRVFFRESEKKDD